ncbi:MAG: prephenate dehydrogenase [Clostridia bacterium]|nr:prephenate dehydrogenase [Clostridia bacterium]
MNVGVVGLGLIGGSVAKAYKAENHTLYCFDTDLIMLDYSTLDGVTDYTLTKDNLSECDLLLLCVYPQAAVDYLRENASYIRKDAMVIDCCGTKRVVCDACFEIAKSHGFTFVGGHPMAGTQYSGFKFSRVDLFYGAPMVIVPPVFDDMKLLDRIKSLLSPLRFRSISVTTAEKHDQMIAFTSQLAHIVSNAYIKSPEAKLHNGFSAGSYKDLTRVAWLNPTMWTQLFMENSDNLLNELNSLILRLSEYRDAIQNGDSEQLWHLLDEGRRIKGEVDG